MRVRVTFSVLNKGGVVPFHHQPLIAQYIKGVLLGSEYENYTSFTFSGLKGQTRVGREGLHVVSSKVTLVVSSDFEPFLRYLVKGIFQLGECLLGTIHLSVVSAEREFDPVFSDSCGLICLSPILLLEPAFNSDHAKQFIRPETEYFSDCLYETAMQRLSDSGKKVDEIPGFTRFQFRPDMEYLGKIDRENKKFSRIYSIYDRDVMFESRGYTVPFVLHAPPEVLRFIYIHGLGHFNHKGFGMLDLADSRYERKTTPFEVDSLETA